MKAIGDNKRCSKCREWKHVDQFHRSASSTDGHACYCRPCSLQASRLYHTNNKDRRNDRSRRYYRENKEKMNELSRLYYQKNREATLEQMKRRRQENPQKFSEAVASSNVRRNEKYRWMQEKLAELGIQV